MTDPPEADILLIRRNTPKWTAAQRARLEVSIRDSKASRILIEFKYTQSFNEEAVTQTAVYDFLYKKAKKLPLFNAQTIETKTRLNYQLITWWLLMKINATEFGTQLGQYLSTVAKEPIIIEKTGNPMAVIMSYTDYERFQEIEDAFWALRALEAEKSGYLGEKSLSELMRVKALKETAPA
jgi:prevent-host-death family protein